MLETARLLIAVEMPMVGAEDLFNELEQLLKTKADTKYKTHIVILEDELSKEQLEELKSNEKLNGQKDKAA